MSLPYQEYSLMNGDTIRKFSKGIDESELVWHRDRTTRSITVEKSGGWLLQIDNELPVKLIDGSVYTIEEMTYHRIIKGDDDLIIRLRESLLI